MKTKFLQRVLWLMIPLLTMFSTNMWADYTITFKTSGATDLINTGGTYATSSETAYVNGTSSGVQFGSGSKGGNILLTMTASGQIQASKITLNGYCKFASNGGNCKVTITFTDNSTENHTPSASTTATNTDVSITNTTKTLKSIKLESTAKNKRFYVTGIKVTAAGGGGCSTDPTASWSTAPSNGTAGGNMNATLTTNYAAGVVYSSSNTSVATVSGNGTTTCAITYVAAGSTRITATVTGDGSTYCTGPATCYTDITVSAPAVSHTVTWLSNGSNYVSPVSYDHGDPLEFPAGTPTAPSGSCSSKVFVGWTSDSEITSETSTAPSFISEGGAVNADVTYRAVFADALTTFSKVTNPSTLRAGDIIAIVSNDNNNGLRVSSNAPAASASTYANAASITPATDMLWTLAGNNTTGFTFTTGSRTTSGPETLGAASVPGNNSSTNVTLSASNNTWKFTSHNTSNCLLISPSSKSTCGLEYYSSAWKIYTKSSGIGSTAATAMRVYRKDYDNYITKCCTDWSVPTLTYSIPGGWKAGDADVNATIGSGTTHGTVSFESSNPSVLTVNTSTGAIHAVGAGTATVTATWPGDATYCPKTCTSATITVSGNVTVVFDKNGGDGTMANQAVPYNTSTALNSNAYTAPSCKYFYGWADTKAEADAGTRDYTDGQNVTLTAGVTLYAVWKTIQYTVARGTGTATGCSGGTFTFSPSTVDCGGTVTITSSPDDNHKGSPTVTILPAGSGTVSGNTITGVSGNITSISVSYAEKVDVTATWNVNNGSVTGGGTTTQKEGSTFTFPNVTSTDCGTFLGWTNAANSSYSSTSGKPTPFYSVGSTIVLNENTQFYAVYSKVGDDAVAGTLYQYNNDGTDLDDDTHGVTPSKSVTNKNSAPWIGFESVGNYIIWDLGGTPTSFSAYLVSSTGGTGSGQSTMVLEQGDKDGGVYTWDATPIATRSTSSASTEISMNITDASKFEKSHLRLRMSEKRMNIRMGAVTINGLIATITYTTNPGCVDWVLDAISVTTAPTKTTYNECEEFDPAGMVVTGSYYENGNPSNTTTKDVAGYTWSPEQFLTPGNTIPVTITYTEKAVTKTTTYNVRVNDLTNYTITFHDGGNTTTWTQSNHCDACNLDSRTGSLACGDYTFAGWSSSSTSYDDQSATITTWVTGSYVPTANTDLYAVYRKGATPPAFTANCEGGTFYIYEANGNTHMAGRVNNTPRAYTSEYWNDDCLSCEGDDGTPFTFTRIADNTYKIQNHDGEYLRKYSSGYHPDFESTWYNEDNFKWIISAGTNGTWRFTSKAATDYALVKSGNYFDFQLASNVTPSSSYYDLELTPAASTVYQSNPNCGSPYTITFETHGGSFVQGNYAYSTATTSGLTDPTVSKFPSATMTGCTFVGWKDGNAQDEILSDNAEGDMSDAPAGLYAANADLSVSSNKTYHAVYHYYDDDWTFDPSEGGTYHMYTLISGTKHYVSSTPTNSWALLTTSTDCGDVKEVTITPGTGANAGKYTIAVDGYNIISENGGTNFKRGDFWWTITARGDGTYAINGMNNDRNIVSNSTGSQFSHCAYNAQGSYSGWYYPYFGRCRQHHWTSTPTITPSITLGQTGNIYITSTNGKTIKATNKLTLSATRYGTTTKIYLSANVAGVGFLKADGTTLPYDSHGTYISTESSGELATTNIVVTYSPTVTTDGIETVTITAQDNSSPSVLATASRTIHVRHLPAKFLIATKVGDDWYALPNNMTAYGNPAAIKLSSVNEATGVATYYSDQYDGEAVGSKNYLTWALYAPVNSDNANYGYKQHGDRLRFADTYGPAHYLELKASDDDIKNSVQSPNTTDHPLCELLPGTNDLIDYTLYNEGQSKYLGVDGSRLWGAYVGSTTVRFLIPNQQPAPTITWYNDMLDADHATNKAENGVVTLPTGADPVSCNSTLLPTFCGWKDGAIATYVTSEPTYVQAGDAATTDKTYYAVFKHATLDRWYTDCPTIYTITYTANGGTGADHLEYTMNTTADAITVGAAGFSKEGCTFVGWTNPDDVDGTIITPGAGKITGLTGDITLNAVWIGTTTVTGTVRLTASAGEKVATGATDVTISSTDFACATALRITYKDVTNDVTYGRSGSPTYTSSEFRLCNGSYGSADGTNISLAEVSGAYNQTFSITYEPNGGANTLDHYQLKIEVLLKNTVIETKTLELYGRTLPASFAIATKIGGAWYALPNNMGSEGTYDPILISVTEDANVLNWTAQGPSTAAYKMKDYTVNYSRLRFAANDANQYCLWAANGDAAGIRNWSASSTDAAYGWIVAETNADFSGYTMATSNNTRTGLMISNNKWGMANSGYSEIHFIPLTTVETIDIIAREWKTNGLVFAIAADNNVSLTSGHTQYGVNAAPTTNVTSITRHSTGGYGLYEVGLADITGDYGKVLSLKMKIGGVDKIANVTIPIIVSGTDVTTAASEPFTTLDAATKDYDVVILEGAKLTTNATASHASKFHNLYVYAGGTLINDNGSTSVNYLEMRGGIKGVAHKEDLAQGVPHLRLNKQISSTNGANLDMYVNTAHSYALSVPFEVSLSGVNYANSLNTSTGAAINGTLDSQFRIMRYDGETRSTGASGWTPITSTSYTLQVGQGYVLQGKRPKGQPFAVIRFPFTGVASWANASGEGGTTGKPAIDIYAHEGGTNTPDNDKGWNLIANPYMATLSYNGADEGWAADFTVGCLEKTNTTPWDGKYSYTETTDAYVTMPNDWYSAFPQYRANSAQAVFEPFKNFFIQTSANGSVLFDRSKRASAPRHLLAQTENVSPIYADINLTHGDDFAQAGLKIDANATTGYKFGEDQNIFENREALTYLKVYTVADGHYLVGNTLTPAETSELIPLEFYAPNVNGDYVFSLDANSDIDRLEYVILYDAELGLSTNLLTNDYSVELTGAGLITERFSIGLKVKEKDNSATGIDDVGGDSERPYKFIYRDKMYIMRGGHLYDATGKQVREIK